MIGAQSVKLWLDQYDKTKNIWFATIPCTIFQFLLNSHIIFPLFWEVKAKKKDIPLETEVNPLFLLQIAQLYIKHNMMEIKLQFKV